MATVTVNEPKVVQPPKTYTIELNQLEAETLCGVLGTLCSSVTWGDTLYSHLADALGVRGYSAAKHTPAYQAGLDAGRRKQGIKLPL